MRVSFFIWTLDKLNCTIPQHILLQEVENGFSKQLALFLSIKKLYESGHIWNKRVELSLLSYRISRNTYNKYIDQLIEKGWVISKEKQLWLCSFGKIASNYSLKEKERYKISFIENGKDLRKNIEKEAQRILRTRQEQKIKHVSPTTSSRSVIVQKNVRGVKSMYNVELENERMISQQKMAYQLGFKSRHTGRTRQKQWAKDKFIDVVNRKTLINEVYAYEIVNEVKRLRRGVYRLGKLFIQVLANEIIIRDNKFGRKIVPIVKSKDEPLVKCYATSEKYQDNW